MRQRAKNVRHGAKNVQHGVNNGRHGAKNMQHNAEIMRHGAQNVWHPHPPILKSPTHRPTDRQKCDDDNQPTNHANIEPSRFSNQ